MNTKHLFSEKRLFDLKHAYPALIHKEVESWNRDRLLGVPEADLIDHLVGKYTLEPPVLRNREEWRMEANETKIDVSGDPMRDRGFRRGPLLVDAQSIRVQVPFDGDGDMFDFQPSTYTMNPPRARVLESSVVFTIEHENDSADQLKQRIDSTISSIESHLDWVRADCAGWNAEVRSVATDCVQHRKELLVKNDALVQQLDIPLKRREDAATAVAVPMKRKRRPAVTPSPASNEKFSPEPTLGNDDYEYILEVISRLSIMIERSPSAFQNMKEDHVRDQILIQLNGHYEGNVSGETFNSSGKTDILIREKDQNVFIGECKFWSGAKAFHAAIDQLLGYATWRDTKTALIVFSRNRDFSQVLQSMKTSIQAHLHFKRTTSEPYETQMRCVFRHPNDDNREVWVAVLAFNIPT